MFTNLIIISTDKKRKRDDGIDDSEDDEDEDENEDEDEDNEDGKKKEDK